MIIIQSQQSDWLIAIIVMFAGTGVVLTLISILSQRRLQRVESRLKSKSEDRPRLLGDETKATIKDKIDGIENMTEGDFDTFIVMMKSLRPLLLEESKISYKCSRCGSVYYSKPKFCSSCGLAAYFSLFGARHTEFKKLLPIVVSATSKSEALIEPDLQAIHACDQTRILERFRI